MITPDRAPRAASVGCLTVPRANRNARWLVDAGAAVLVADQECTAERIGALVDELLSDQGRLDAMAAAARTVARPDAAEAIAAAVRELAAA